MLMYCTGGVRCETASALVRQHCDAVNEATDSCNSITEVLQLLGGIERYLQAYPDRSDLDPRRRDGLAPEGSGATEEAYRRRGAEAGGDTARWLHDDKRGFFRGKNFVFDERYE